MHHRILNPLLLTLSFGQSQAAKGNMTCSTQQNKEWFQLFPHLAEKVTKWVKLQAAVRKCSLQWNMTTLLEKSPSLLLKEEIKDGICC